MTDPIRIYALTGLVTCRKESSEHALNDHGVKNGLGTDGHWDTCGVPQPVYRPLELTTVCGTCGGSGIKGDRGGRFPGYKCPDCVGGRVPVALREVIEQTMRTHLPVRVGDSPVLCICDVKLTFDGPIAHRLHVADAVIAELVAQGEKE